MTIRPVFRGMGVSAQAHVRFRYLVYFMPICVQTASLHEVTEDVVKLELHDREREPTPRNPRHFDIIEGVDVLSLKVG